MPVTRTRNSTILPANARVVDAAQEAIRSIIPVQQRRYSGALAIQGYSSLIYNLLEAGQPCSCSAKNKALAARMNQEGKLPTGKINELITGGHEFRVKAYGTRRTETQGYRDDNGDPAPVRPELIDENQTSNNQVTAPFVDHVARNDTDDPAARHIEPEGDVFGVNGPLQSPDTISDLDGSDFDPDSFALSDVSCPICLGTSYVGGASLIGGWRKILVPQDTVMTSDGSINTLKRPISVENTTYAQWTVVLPKGAWAMDALNVWNNNKIAPCTIMVDSIPIQKEHDLINLCDGKSHTFVVLFSTPSEFTHVELQLALSNSDMKIDFPKLSQGADITKLDGTEDVQLVASPDVPLLRRKDLIVESSFGKVFQIINVTLWNDNQRKLLGWDTNARVVQPQELYNLLPRRKVTKQPTTVPVRPNPNPV